MLLVEFSASSALYIIEKFYKFFFGVRGGAVQRTPLGYPIIVMLREQGDEGTQEDGCA